jgi:hypothetical protein
MVPRLTTALTGPRQELERSTLGRMPEIECWLRKPWQEHAVQDQRRLARGCAAS